jgi:sulfur transfer complex TusBCD TusB component (DsrH family)
MKPCPGLLAAGRVKETLAMLLIGDGVLGLIDTHRHLRLWQQGPPAWRAIMEAFLRRPGVTRLISASEIAFGLWLAVRQRVE